MAVLLERISDPVFVLDHVTGFFCEANSGALDLVGLSRAELLRTRPDDFLADGDGWTLPGDPDPDGSSSHEPRVIEVRRADGTYAVRELHTGPPALNGHQVLVLVDISRRRAQEDRRLNRHSLETLISERHRIARDLHDGVIQDIIGASFLLASLRTVVSGDLHNRLDELIDVHDRLVRTIRSLVFDLAQPVTPTASLSRSIHDVVRQATPSLGLSPDTVIDGVDIHPPSAVLVGHILLSLREMLSNVARHSEAGAVRVEVRSTAEGVEVVVADDGIGIGSTADGRPGSGLANLAERATSVGGLFVTSSAGESGTVARWSAPHHDDRNRR